MYRDLRKTFLLVSIMMGSPAVWLSGPVGAYAQSTERHYVARFTNRVPAIDGQLTSPDEWSLASEAQGDWVLLQPPRNSTPDSTNNRFQILWDDNGMYLLHQVDHRGWSQRGTGSVEYDYENLNLFLDPNLDGEDNAVPNADVDAYQIILNQPLGFSEITPDQGTAAMEAEAHQNAIIGNSGGPFSGFKNMRMAQTTDNDTGTGFTEIFLPWIDFDATSSAGGFTENDLFHPYAPENGERWYFNIGRVESSGRAPAWMVASESARIFAQRPHGILEFEGKQIGCDLNADGGCDAMDIDLLSKIIRDQTMDFSFDLNSDGQLDRDDRLFWVNDLMNTYVGDSNLDGEFNTGDFVKVFQIGQYEDAVPLNSGWSEGDWNGDGDFGSGDFVAAFQSGGFEQGPRQAARAIPEPSSWLLAAMALWGIWGIRAGKATAVASRRP